MNTQALVSSYESVRDWPFEVILNTTDNLDLDLEAVRRRRRGSCSQKHYLLGSVFEKLGIQVLYSTFPFNWSDLKVRWPDHLKELAAKMPLQFHLALIVNVDHSEVLLDATWDPPLSLTGFQINQLNGHLENTNLAVIPAGPLVIHRSIPEREQYIRNIAQNLGAFATVKHFYSALNNWLEHIRRSAG